MSSGIKFLPVFLDIDSSRVAGNSPDDLKRALIFTLHKMAGGFAASVGRKLELKESGTQSKKEEPRKRESRVVCETVVDNDMVNGGGHLHGGCIAYMVDLCSTLVIMVYTHSVLGELQSAVSQSLSIVYHSPAAIGDRLRIVNTTLSVGGRTMSASVEIWNDTHHRLVATGVHVKMNPSAPKANAKL